MDTISEAGKELTISSPQDKILSGSISPSHNVNGQFQAAIWLHWAQVELWGAMPSAVTCQCRVATAHH